MLARTPPARSPRKQARRNGDCCCGVPFSPRRSHALPSLTFPHPSRACSCQGNTDFDAMSEFVIKLPVTEEFVSPIMSVVPLQLLSYYIADYRGCSVDQPRNLAKSVTVE